MLNFHRLLPLLALFSALCASAAEDRIAVGRYHNLAVGSNGEVYWWGTEFSTQRLDPPLPSHISPTVVDGLNNIQAVAAGWEHSLALDTSGAVFEWGYSPYKMRKTLLLQPLLGGCEALRLLSGGHGKDPCRDEEQQRARRMWVEQPIRIPDIPPAKAIRALDGASVAITRSGEVYCWAPYAAPQKIPGLENIKDVQLGQFHGVALREDGTVLTWGSNANGELGRPGEKTDNASICRNFNVATALTGASGIAASTKSSFAFKADGQIWGWGNNWSNQMGISTNPNGIEPHVLAPRLIATLPGTVQLAASDTNELARTADGHLYTWGSNFGHAFGIASDLRRSLTPLDVTPRYAFQGVYLSEDHAVISDAGNYLCTWGNNYYGQSRPDSKKREIPLPVPVLMSDRTTPFNPAAPNTPPPASLCGDQQWRQHLDLL